MIRSQHLQALSLKLAVSQHSLTKSTSVTDHVQSGHNVRLLVVNSVKFPFVLNFLGLLRCCYIQAI